MSVLEKIVSVFAAHTCIGCGVEENVLLCEGCRQSLAPVPSRCYKCKAVTNDYAVCQRCVSQTPLRQVIVYTHHADLAKELIHHMKYERARSGIAEAAEMLSEHMVYLGPTTVLVPVPTATARVRTRGYDHATVLAQALARQGDFPARIFLRRVGQAHQVGARRAERLRQLQTAFRALHVNNIRGKHIVLVDDVLTTGATLETAARTLRRSGAKRVDAIVFAQA